ncbi:DM13 domain-containing protein [Alteromonas sp. 5E99-2]|uniref:DM13 domain-containing protein n=1 Tax=Alteromonas sp. 5E99-2 TaxID=2817683 RepID=UPI001A98306B|nr:DM13 domain-containing protein [Alteromonas sp. 5E99-2]MBO1256288.1 DM13 domain-containing protein [Alteromonas sp. 5E99-2]
MKQPISSNLIKAGITTTALVITLSACSNEKSTEDVSQSEADNKISTPATKMVSEEKSEVTRIVTDQVAELTSESDAIIEKVAGQVDDLKNDFSNQVEVPEPVTEVTQTVGEKVESASEKTVEITESVNTVIEQQSEVSNSASEPTLKDSVENEIVDNSTVDELAADVVIEPKVEIFSPRSGSWTKKSKKIQGQWRIEKRDGDAYLILGDDFKTSKAPDLKFVLSNQTVSDVANKNAMQNALFVADLKSPKGAQEYKLPENFSDYTTLLLHCEKYTKLWGAANIQ